MHILGGLETFNNEHAYVTDLVGIWWSSNPEGQDSSGTDRVEYNSAVQDTSPDLKYIHHCAVYVQGDNKQIFLIFMYSVDEGEKRYYNLE